MSFRSWLNVTVGAVVAAVSISCATSKIVGKDIRNVVDGQPMDNSGLGKAIAADARDVAGNLEQLHRKLLEAYAQLRANVEKRWGKGDTRMADRTVYVKYTQGYRSRVVTDFNRGSITVETVDDKAPRQSLQSAIVSALLTSNDPSTVDLFTDKDVTLVGTHRPYLYGLVHDQHGKSISTRQQAEAFAHYLLAHKLRSRTNMAGRAGTQAGTSGGTPTAAGADMRPEIGATAWFVQLDMVRNFEAKGAERYRASVEKYAAQYAVSPSLVLAIMRTESNFNPFAVSAAPAYGLMQLVPTSGGRAALKRSHGIDETPTAEYLFDPDHSIELGAAYLGILSNEEFRPVTDQRSRDYCVIAAYNTGARNVTRTFARERKQALGEINRLPADALYDRLRTNLPYGETREYVVKVTGYRRQFELPIAPVTAMQ